MNKFFQAPHDPSVLELFINRLNHSSCSFLVYIPSVCLWQILYPDSLQNIIKSSPNIIECIVTTFVEFIETHQSVLLVFILIYEASRIGLVIISTNCDPIQMLVIMPFDNLKLCNGNDFVPGVDITSRFPVDSISIKLLTLSPLEKSCSSHDRELEVLLISKTNPDAERPLQHVVLQNCPKSLHGQFKRRDHKYPTLMLEAVADQKLWIWHAYFGVPWENNDLNVLYGSLLIDDELADRAPECPFVVNGHTYRKAYYLADGIYPTWYTFIKTFSIARDEKTLKFKRVYEAARKDIEGAFGVLQGFEVNMRDMVVSPEPQIQRN
nr:hypothetical protein [Tanacetum cinerariifolium]